MTPDEEDEEEEEEEDEPRKKKKKGKSGVGSEYKYMTEIAAMVCPLEGQTGRLRSHADAADVRVWRGARTVARDGQAHGGCRARPNHRDRELCPTRTLKQDDPLILSSR